MNARDQNMDPHSHIDRPQSDNAFGKDPTVAKDVHHEDRTGELLKESAWRYQLSSTAMRAQDIIEPIPVSSHTAPHEHGVQEVVVRVRGRHKAPSSRNPFRKMRQH